MKTFLLSTTAALALVASIGHAEPVADQVIRQLQGDGYYQIEVTSSPNQVKIEAIKNGFKFEAIYDAVTGALLSREFEPVEGDEDMAPGVSSGQKQMTSSMTMMTVMTMTMMMMMTNLSAMER